MKSKSKKQTKLIVEEIKPSEPTKKTSEPILENKTDLSKNQDIKKSKKQKPVKLSKQEQLDLKLEEEKEASKRAALLAKPENFFTKKRICIIVFFLVLFLARIFKVVLKL